MTRKPELVVQRASSYHLAITQTVGDPVRNN